MPYSDGELNGIQAEAVALLTDIGYTYEPLNAKELRSFARAFERQFILAYPEREVVDLYRRHVVEIMAGALVAKKQMSAEVDGEQPNAGKVGGPIPIRAAYLGVGDDWDDVGDTGSFTAGSVQNWIHSGTPMMGGDDGNAVKVGENQVTVVIAIGDRHPSPKVESVQFTIDGKAKPILILSQAQQMPGNGLKLKELEKAYLFKEDMTVLAAIFGSSVGGSVTTLSCIPYLLGASYIKEDQLRVHDAASVDGTTPDVIMTT
jgi:hypothetical protein